MVNYNIDGLVQDCSISTVCYQWRYCSLALSHWYDIAFSRTFINWKHCRSDTLWTPLASISEKFTILHRRHIALLFNPYHSGLRPPPPTGPLFECQMRLPLLLSNHFYPHQFYISHLEYIVMIYLYSIQFTENALGYFINSYTCWCHYLKVCPSTC